MRTLFAVCATVAIMLLLGVVFLPIQTKPKEKPLPTVEEALQGYQVSTMLWKGHSWVYFYYNGNGTVVHNPDCMCIQK